MPDHDGVLSGQEAGMGINLNGSHVLGSKGSGPSAYRWPMAVRWWRAAGITLVLLTAAACTSTGSSGSGAPASPATATASAAAPSSAVPSSGVASSLEQQYEQVVSRVLPSVVQISTSQGSGSGVVYDAKGDIVSNAHVVGTATTPPTRR